MQINATLPTIFPECYQRKNSRSVYRTTKVDDLSVKNPIKSTPSMSIIGQTQFCNILKVGLFQYYLFLDNYTLLHYCHCQITCKNKNSTLSCSVITSTTEEESKKQPKPNNKNRVQEQLADCRTPRPKLSAYVIFNYELKISCRDNLNLNFLTLDHG